MFLCLKDHRFQKYYQKQEVIRHEEIGVALNHYRSENIHQATMINKKKKNVANVTVMKKKRM